MSVFPISFSIDESKVIDTIPNKHKLLATIIPGIKETYIFNEEKEYYKDYQNSMFAITTKKAGWDCLRHYEILANGCIPYFPNIVNCPKNTMVNFPKDIIIETNKLYDIINNNIANLDDKLQKIYFNYLNILLEYTKNNLTSNHTVEYILNNTNNKHAKKILFLSGVSESAIGPDYLRCLTLIGFKNIFGSNCHDFPKIKHIYTDYTNEKNIYGKGISYTKIIDKKNRNDILDQTILDDIKKHYYDIIIYGSYHRGIPFFDDVIQYYKNNEVIFICGEDIHNCNYEQLTNNGFNVFVRELN